MEKYGVFKVDGGYAVALAVYLDGPVMGHRMWFDAEDKAQDYAEKIQAYNNAYEDFEESLQYMDRTEINQAKAPCKADFKIIEGILI